MEGRVSVIVTVWQRTDFLAGALRSVAAQTLPPDEVIVTDDSNSAAIRRLCEGAGMPGLRYRTNAGQLGTAGNVAAALSEATGEWVAILNDDDAWEPDFLARLVPPLREDRRRVLAFADHWIMDHSGRVLERESDANTARYGRDRLSAGEVGPLAPLIFDRLAVALAVAALWRRDAVSPADLSPEAGPLYDLWLGALLAAKQRPAVYVPGRVSRYRVHGAMETNRFSPRRELPRIFIYRELLRRGWFPSHAPLFLHRQHRACLRCGLDHLAGGLGGEGRHWLAEAAATGGGWKVSILRALACLPMPLPGLTVRWFRAVRAWLKAG